MNHADLVAAAVRWLRGTMRCGVVLAERGVVGGEIPDAIGWSGYGSSCLVECKASRADFLRDRDKSWRNAWGMGRTRWYLTPPSLLQAEEIPAGWGLAEYGGRRVRICRAAQPQTDRDTLAEATLLANELRRYQLHGITYPPLNAAATRRAKKQNRELFA